MTEPIERPAPAGPSRWRWLVWFGLLLLLLPPVVYQDNVFRLSLFAKFLALAVLALGVDLIWGYTGMLSLGQGLYFAVGAYSVALSLKLKQAAADAGGDAVPGTVPPDYMNYTNLPVTHPDYHPPAALAWIAPLADIRVALLVAVLLPTLLAFLFGMVTFRLRIRGVYFALITQALLYAVYTLVEDQQRYTGGVVGVKNLADMKLFGVTFNPYKHVLKLYWLVAGTLAVCLFGCWLLVNSRFGKVLTAIRDNENRVLALGYNTALYRTTAFAIAGGLAGLGGALFAVANELAGQEYLSITFSIEMVVLVAVGGRGTLFGAVLGAVLVSEARTRISEAAPEWWPIVLGCLFIGSVLLLPDGIVGGLTRLGRKLFRRRPTAAAAAVAGPSANGHVPTDGTPSFPQTVRGA